MTIPELCDRLRSEADDLGAFGRDTECTVVLVAADLIEALVAEREAHEMRMEYSADTRPLDARRAARARVDEIIGRMKR